MTKLSAWLRKAAHPAEIVIGHLSEKLGMVAVGLLLLIMLFTVTEVFLRYVFNRPIAATMELSELMMVVLVFFALSWCALKERHIKVDLIISRLPQKTQRFFDITNYLLVIFVSVLVGWRSFAEAYTVREIHITTEMAQLPIYPFYWVITSGFLLLALVVVVSLVRYIHKMVRS